MDLELVTVGTELLLGFTADGNTAELGRLLSSVGCNVVRSTSVPDQRAAIRDAVSGSLARTGMVVITGGLGPTRDDITKKVVADIFDAPLVMDRDYLAKLQKRFARVGLEPMPESNRSQAEVPEGAICLRNPRGTAPGLWLEGAPGTAIMLPGVPAEMRRIAEAEVVPRIWAKAQELDGEPTVTRSNTLRTTGISESSASEVLRGVESELGDVSLSYLPGIDGLDLRLTIHNAPPAVADDALERPEGILHAMLTDRLYGSGSTMLSSVVVQMLKENGMRLAVAESCTGGLVGARIVAVPGASEVFAGGMICYDDSAKARNLGVPKDVLAESGAVSEPVARAMVDGVIERFGVDVGVAVTGIAGPTGGTETKPVGTVWLAAAVSSYSVAEQRWFPGQRDEVRERSAQAALDLVRGLLTAR